VNGVFWKAALTADEAALLQATLMAHRVSTFRNNPSTAALLVAFDASGSYPQALISALSTLGERHGPIVATYEFLCGPDPEQTARRMLSNGERIPGWGTSFKDDETWNPVRDLMRARFVTMAKTLDAVTEVMHTAGKMIHPNPSAYTAATAILLDLPKDLSPWLLVQGRLAAWSTLLLSAKGAS
jgi:citrate synthase